MAIIEPLQGWRYDPAKADPARVVAPPYDVIDPARQDALYAQDPANIIRVILGKEAPGDAPGADRYSRAAAQLDEWKAAGVLRRDPPSFYVYEQEFNTRAENGGPRATRRGFFARVLLSEWGKGGVFPHEKTLAGPKADRLRLMRATNGDPEPVFALQTDPDGALAGCLAKLASGRAPSVEAAESDGCVNRLYQVDGAGELAALSACAAAPRLYIADGHHRYETALAYRDEVRARRFPGGAPAPECGALDCDYILMLIVPDSDPGLVIWPTHRMVHGVEGFAPDKLLEGCRRDFDVAPFDAAGALLADMDADAAPAFGLAVDGKLWRLRLKRPEAMAARAPEAPAAWRELDVSVLHRLILEELLGIDEGKLLRKENIRYTKSADEAIEAANRHTDGTQGAFLLRSTRMEQLRAVADAGAVMPQKSTYFYPKALSGLLVNLFE